MSLAFQKILDPTYAKLSKQVEENLNQPNARKALVSALEFVRKYPTDGLANFSTARAFIKNFEMRNALPHAIAAQKAKPDNFDYILILGRIYMDLKLYEYAAPLLHAASEKHPDNFKIRWALADFLYAIGRGKQANHHYEIALQLEASDSDKCTMCYDFATCLKSMSLTDDADKYFTFYGQNPTHAPNALARRSMLRRYLPDSDMAKQVQAMLETKTINISDRAELLQSLGNMNESAGNYDEAFELWTKSRSFKSKTLADRLGFDLVQDLKQFYSKDLFIAARAYGHQSNKPLFVVGMPRSGTTLIEQVLGGHSSCYGAGELGRMHRLEIGFRTAYSKGDHVKTILENAKKNELKIRAEETLSLLAKLAGPTALHVIDKTPTHYATMGISALFFPNSKFIHTQRHPVDTFISSYQNNMNESHAYSYDQETYAEAYLAKEKLMAHWRECFPDRIYDLKYERLVAKPEETVREVLAFLGLPWDENCMQFFNKGNMVKTFSTAQVRNPIYTSSVYRWKNYEKHLGPLFAALKAANYEYPEI